MPTPTLPPGKSRSCAKDGADVAGISFEDVYERLKALAHRQLESDSRNTLDTTALVHELYLRMESGGNLRFDESARYFGYAARAMRNLLINRARDRVRQKAGGDWARVTTMGAAGDPAMAIASAEQALAIDEALNQLEQSEPRAARVFELRYFAGLAADQIADLLEVTRRTVDRDWRFARAFLLAVLDG